MLRKKIDNYIRNWDVNEGPYFLNPNQENTKEKNGVYIDDFQPKYLDHSK